MVAWRIVRYPVSRNVGEPDMELYRKPEDVEAELAQVSKTILEMAKREQTAHFHIMKRL